MFSSCLHEWSRMDDLMSFKRAEKRNGLVDGVTASCHLRCTDWLTTCIEYMRDENLKVADVSYSRWTGSRTSFHLSFTPLTVSLFVMPVKITWQLQLIQLWQLVLHPRATAGESFSYVFRASSTLTALQLFCRRDVFKRGFLCSTSQWNDSLCKLLPFIRL